MDSHQTFEEYLDQNGSLTYSTKGVSMLPLLHENRDLIILEKHQGAGLKPGDVVLYRRHPNQYVLHRVMEVREHDYVILGDNCIGREYGITDDDILGVMTGFVRKGREYRATDRSYRVYTWFILHTVSLRIGYKRLRIKVRQSLSRLYHIWKGRARV